MTARKAPGKSSAPQPKAAAGKNPRPIPAQAGTGDPLHGSPDPARPRRPVSPQGAADDLHGGLVRPVITGAADSVMGAPLTPPPRRPLPKSGTSTPKAMKDDKHSE